MLGLDPVPGPPCAFSIEPGAIRYGDFPRADPGIEFREFQEVDLPSGIFGEGILGPTLLEEGRLRAALEDLLGKTENPPDEASLVLPDSWLRVVFTEITDLPRSASEREEILRWKLKRLVPFKVEALRLDVVEVDPLPTQVEPHRMLMSFAAETLVSHLEIAFSSYGIRLGRISNVSLSLLEAVREAGGGEGVQAVVSVDTDSYTVLFTRAGEPVIYRHKPLPQGATGEGLESAVRRELRLTRAFVDKQLAGARDVRVYLFDRSGTDSDWVSWLSEDLGSADVRVADDFLRAGGLLADADAVAVAPLMGAACTLVA